MESGKTLNGFRVLGKKSGKTLNGFRVLGKKNQAKP